MNMRRIALLLIVALAVSFGAFANGSAEVAGETVNFTVEELVYEPVRTVTVDPSSEILAVFENYGIDSYYLLEGTWEDDDDNEFTTPAPVTQEVQSELVVILQENRDGVVDMINAELQSHLHRDGAEEANMTIGSYFFTAALDYPQA